MQLGYPSLNLLRRGGCVRRQERCDGAHPFVDEYDAVHEGVAEIETLSLLKARFVSIAG
ncbi:hypothetical protein [Diaminobutyricibacter sp. McL0608]|uniref:hypothetical protein n=1 Tax=Leifsonia sp. McL0608 TaxID=3143537 RepID=UPI0031F2F223